jgi:hypothetical protein
MWNDIREVRRKYDELMAGGASAQAKSGNG